jgi:hypothetical protein
VPAICSTRPHLGFGRLFIQFRIVLDGQPGSTVTIDVLGPGLDDGSSSGAFAQQAVTAQQWANGDPSLDPNDAFNFVGGTLSITTVPEPAGLALLTASCAHVLARARGSARKAVIAPGDGGKTW